MADAYYGNFRNLMFGGGVHAQVDCVNHDIRVMLYDEGTVALDLANHQDYADIVTAEVGTNTALTGLTVGSTLVGAFDHADETVTSVTGSTVESLTYFDYETAVNSTSPVICNLDSWTGLPLTPNGGNVILAPHANGVFQIT